MIRFVAVIMISILASLFLEHTVLHLSLSVSLFHTVPETSKRMYIQEQNHASIWYYNISCRSQQAKLFFSAYDYYYFEMRECTKSSAAAERVCI